MADLGKPSAHSYAASQAAEAGMSPLHFGDKCFLCGREIGETDPRQFYRGSMALALCHTGCLNVMNANGGKPADYHRATGGTPAPQAAPDPDRRSYTGPGWLEFPDLAAMVNYVRDKGEIPGCVKVTVAGAVVQAGE